MKAKYIAGIIAIVLLVVLSGCQKADVEVSGATVKDRTDNLTGKEETNKTEDSNDGLSTKELIDKLTEEAGLDSEKEDEAAKETSKAVSEEATITIINFKGEPADLNIKVGTTVTWKNDMDNMIQIIVILPKREGGVYSSKEINELVRIMPGDSYSFTFTEEGSYKWGSKTKFDKIYGFIEVTE